MNCPLCVDSTLDVTYHAGIEVDICPRCQGVWLDRGELNRLVAEPVRSAGDVPVTSSPDRNDASPTKPGENKSKKQRKKSLADRLGDVFEEIIDL